MRRLAPWLLALPGCLSAPTGLDRDGGGSIDASPDAEPDHVWPPEGDIDFQAIASGDLSGDAAEDLIAVNVGATNTGVFLLVAGVDVDPAVAAVATTYTKYKRIDSLKAPVAARIIGDQVVILDNPSSGARITVLETDSLDQVAQYDTGGPAAPTSARPSLRVLGFGPTGETLGIVNGDNFRILSVGDLAMAAPDLLDVPPPGGGWTGVQLVDVYVDTNPIFLAGLLTTAYTSPVPMGGSQVWTSERTGPMWTAQTTGAIKTDGNDDGKVDLIGFDPNAASNATLCVLDVVANAAPTCLATPISDDSGLVLLYDNVAPGPDNDLVVALPGPVGTRFDVFPVFRVTGTAVATDPSPVPQTFTGASAHLVTADLDTAVGPRMIVQLADDGALTCVTVRPDPTGLVRCSD